MWALHRAAADWERDRIRRMLTAATEAARRDGKSMEPGTPFGGLGNRLIGRHAGFKCPNISPPE
jgi:hypothetical protein